MNGNILAIQNQQAIIADVIDVKMDAYSHKTQTNKVNNKGHAESE